MFMPAVKRHTHMGVFIKNIPFNSISNVLLFSNMQFQILESRQVQFVDMVLIFPDKVIHVRRNRTVF